MSIKIDEDECYVCGVLENLGAPDGQDVGTLHLVGVLQVGLVLCTDHLEDVHAAADHLRGTYELSADQQRALAAAIVVSDEGTDLVFRKADA